MRKPSSAEPAADEAVKERSGSDNPAERPVQRPIGVNPCGLVLGQIREIERLVRSTVASWQGGARTSASRRGHRAPYHKPIILTPLDDRTEEPNGRPVCVAGRDISPSGISFTHSVPLPCRKAAVELPEARETPAMLVVRLSWCRCTRDGIYQSGGRFLRTMDLG